MSTLEIELLGYCAAVITNISVYPQAYEVYIIVQRKEYSKLNALSPVMYSLQTTGCFCWLTYALLLNIYPIVFGSITCIIPSSYILFCVLYYKQQEQPQEIYQEQSPITISPQDDTEIIIASSCSFPSE